MFIKYQINDVDVDIIIRRGILNVDHIVHIESIEDISAVRIYQTNQMLEFRFVDQSQSQIAYLSFIEALQHVGTNHEFIKLTVIPNF